MDKKLEVQVDELENSNEKFSSTEGYYGEGIYDSNIEYKKYNSEHFYKILKKKYKKTNFLKDLFQKYGIMNFLMFITVLSNRVSWLKKNSSNSGWD